MSSIYLERYAYPNVLIAQEPGPGLGLIITIPAFKEEGLLRSLEALAACDRPNCAVEVIVLVNQPVDTPGEVSEINYKSYKEALAWAKKTNDSGLHFHILYRDDLPAKHAGVGLARKIAMDEAVRRYEYLQNDRGIIACFDADCTCDPNYLVELKGHFERHPGTPGCSIYFEHPLYGALPSAVYEAIIHYELFLRYYTGALRLAGFPGAYQAIGSSMAVRNNAYQKQGGMNRRKAGEDFYFLQRIIALGSFTELNTTRVIPSPRTSDRVPFGTGKAVQDWIDQRPREGYSPQIFLDLKKFIGHCQAFYEASPPQVKNILQSLPMSIRAFLESVDFHDELERLHKQSTSPTTFQKHFFQWFNGFTVLKYVHFVRDRYYGNVSLTRAARWLLEELVPGQTVNAPKAMLQALRLIDRSSTWGNHSEKNRA